MGDIDEIDNGINWYDIENLIRYGKKKNLL